LIEQVARRPGVLGQVVPLAEARHDDAVEELGRIAGPESLPSLFAAIVARGPRTPAACATLTTLASRALSEDVFWLAE
jgi:hypothetical protein